MSTRISSSCGASATRTSQLNSDERSVPPASAVSRALRSARSNGLPAAARFSTEVTPAGVRNGETVVEATTSDMGVRGGIVMGLVGATLYRRYPTIDLPDYLAFFGGRRFVPIVTAFAAIAIGAVVAFLVIEPATARAAFRSRG